VSGNTFGKKKKKKKKKEEIIAFVANLAFGI
jgi:hypothetical protein